MLTLVGVFGDELVGLRAKSKSSPAELLDSVLDAALDFFFVFFGLTTFSEEALW